MAIHYPTFNVDRPAYLNGGQWQLSGLSDVSIIFGKNGAGKSTLLKRLRGINNKIFHYITPERSGEITHDLSIMQEALREPSLGNRRQQNAAPTFRQEAISKVQALLFKIGNLTGRNQAPSPVDLGEIEGFLHILLPSFEFKITGGDPPFEIWRISDNGRVSSVTNLSSGETEVIVIGLDILTMCAMWELDGQEQRVLLIDEPDTHLHPDLQQHLADFLVKISDRFNVQEIISTHSTTLLSALGYYGATKTSIVYLNNAVEVQNAIGFERSLQELATCLGGHALMGPLFSAPMLLVEGNDDYQIWSQVPRHHQVNFATIPCSGEEIYQYQKTLEKMFAALRPSAGAPVGYALLDGDRNTPDPANPEVPQNHVAFLKLVCRESENLYFTAEVLSEMGTDWTAAKTKIAAESSGFGTKAPLLANCANWDLQNDDLKNIIAEVSRIIDPKSLPWQVRVGKAIGKRRPTGELLSFLGESVVNTLWGNQ